MTPGIPDKVKEVKSTKRVRRIPSPVPVNCVPMTPEQSLKFILGIDSPDWTISGIVGGKENGVDVTHYNLSYIGSPGICPDCGMERAYYDHKSRTWRHANLDKAVCYLHADIPRYRCPKCGKINQVDIPWADPKVTYTKRFMEVAIEHMSQMSILATARLMITSWSVLDGIVGKVVKEHLGRMDLSKVQWIRIDETSAKKRHKYLTLVTDVETGDIIFITKGNKAEVVKEFAEWLEKHHGHRDNIKLVASDFGSSFLSGVKKYLKNAESVLDPFHLIQLANKNLDRDRASEQVNGQRQKSIRFAALKGRENLSEKEREVLMDFTRDHEKTALSYQMKESLRDIFNYTKDEIGLARIHLTNWADWAIKEGSKDFRALGNTVKKNIDAILRAIETGINNGYQEGMNGRVQLSKAIGRGYHREMRLGRIVYFRDATRSY